RRVDMQQPSAGRRREPDPRHIRQGAVRETGGWPGNHGRKPPLLQTRPGFAGPEHGPPYGESIRELGAPAGDTGGCSPEALIPVKAMVVKILFGAHIARRFQRPFSDV